ncbi:MAG: DUF2155 domain-containing protein [Natronohydrobacter sp.]|jgi:hypothetical protein|nr:DUF2155 domain-containing protein [Natronohydrobacter sp.]
MRALRLACALLCASSLALHAQDDEVPTASDRIANGNGAILRGLDRVAGTSEDLTLSRGGEARIGHLIVMLEECRYPVENPAGEAYAWIDIFDTRADEIIFSGWMIASSPALNALDHARYDLWVLRCTTS